MKCIVPDASLPWPERLDWLGADRMATTIEPFKGCAGGAQRSAIQARRGRPNPSDFVHRHPVR
jgi:hypothetical protein